MLLRNSIGSLVAALGALLLLPPHPLRAQSPAPLRPGDALLVRIENLGGGLPEYREVVDSEGRIELPYLGTIAAAGKTPAELAAEMANAYLSARLSSNAIAHLSFVTHCEPPPDRSNLVRSQDPRRPVPVGEVPLP